MHPIDQQELITRAGALMKTYAIFLRALMILSISIGSFESRSEAGPTLLEDHFSEKDDQTWKWNMVNQADYFIDGHLDLFVRAGATDHVYNNAEITSLQSFQRKDLEIVLRNESLDQGSRGWGYWNQTYDAHQMELAWFIFLRGDQDYPLNGFFIMTKRQGEAPLFYRLDENYLLSTHTYSIQWMGESLLYKIDGVEILRVDGNIPEGSMKLDIWSDNAVYDPKTYQKALQNVLTKAVLRVDWVKVIDN